jgi:hypothetical protein
VTDGMVEKLQYMHASQRDLPVNSYHCSHHILVAISCYMIDSHTLHDILSKPVGRVYPRAPDRIGGRCTDEHVEGEMGIRVVTSEVCTRPSLPSFLLLILLPLLLPFLLTAS